MLSEKKKMSKLHDEAAQSASLAPPVLSELQSQLHKMQTCLAMLIGSTRSKALSPSTASMRILFSVFNYGASRNLSQKEAYLEEGFLDWSRHDFQQLVRALEKYGWTDDYELFATYIHAKTLKEV
ncbi:hypothetical protein PILCRDRAFT_93664 [Piloderma croceum F 1598]|uniref:Uncharacterized protein n=1 Tax=Piloderma croceum (strain F 1598) TaxID=765440 RepID=A0A0C3EVR2_PILCF|nr:hypothetical protein PILCRDRAFT_93664 [Piloderma croceum F 1598]